MNRKSFFLALLCAQVLFFSLQTNAQGCSDSGFCTMGAFRPDQPDLRKAAVRLIAVEMTQHLGFTPFNDVIHSTFVDASFGIGNNGAFQVRLPAYTIIVGELETNRGWGDVFVNYSHSIINRPNFNINLVAGAKFATTAPTVESEDGLPLPLYRQVAFGSNDVNFGASLVNRNWTIAAGYQRALNQIDNQFQHSDWEGHDLEEKIAEYDESAGLARGDDLMLRIERNLRLSRFNLFGGPLALWRINEDQVLNPNGILEEVEGSAGLALNFVFGAGYQFNTRMGIRLLNSVRLVEREANPDGLNRTFISQFAYIVQF
jgi:hypothetical protein